MRRRGGIGHGLQSLSWQNSQVAARYRLHSMDLPLKKMWSISHIGKPLPAAAAASALCLCFSLEGSCSPAPRRSYMGQP